LCGPPSVVVVISEERDVSIKTSGCSVSTRY
jgi:hypothetical protein